MEKYSYEDVKKAYQAIIEVGKARVHYGGVFGGQILIQNEHRKNLKKLNDSARELYERLLNDNSINY